MGRNRGRLGLLIGGIAVIAVAALVAVLLLRGGDGGNDRADRARENAEAFLSDWAGGDLAAAAARTDDAEAAESLLGSVQENMRPEALAFEISGDPAEPESADAPEGALNVPFTATFTLEGIGEWSYESAALLVPAAGDGEEWTVRWESALVHPQLEEGQTLVLSTEDAERGAILAADGSELAGPSTVWDITIWPAQLEDPDAAYDAIEAMDQDIDIPGLRDRVESSPPDQAVQVITLRDEEFQQVRPALTQVSGIQFNESSRTLAHAARPLVGGLDPETGAGASGLQQRYDDQLSGTPAAAVVIADRESGEAVETLHEQEDAAPGEPVETTLDLGVQQAAEDALEELGRNASIVAVQPSTGAILAAADYPADGFNRSLQGQLPPGSTFKVITAAALLEGGTAMGDALGCPQFVSVDGQTFENQDQFELGPDTTLHDTFTNSCNTAFIDNRDRFENDTLNRTAAAFGIGGVWEVGASTYDGSVPVTESPNALAASLIGQGEVLASPLVMASVAATVADGTFRQPVLVPDAVEERHEAASSLGEGTISALRTMMRDTVTEGSASALRGVPGAPHGKTGTAEFTDENGDLSTHAWIIGFLGERDLAFAVMLEAGGSGGADAGPVAADFLNRLP